MYDYDLKTWVVSCILQSFRVLVLSITYESLKMSTFRLVVL